MPQEIIIDVDQQGNVKIEGKGFQGTECTQLTAAIEQELGEVANRELKPEYRQARTNLRTAGR